MKKILLVLGILMANNATAQIVLHTDSSLNSINKGQLVDIYIEQVNQLIEKLPYSVWGLNAEDKALDIPKSKYMNSKRKGVANDASKYIKTNDALMYEVVYYADKQRLVNAVLYLQKLNIDIFNVK